MCSNHHSGMNERIEKLKKETIDLRKEVEYLKETLLRQNELIINLLSKQTGILAETQEKISVFSWRFPLEDLQDLKKFEDEINDKNKNQIVNIVQPLLASKSLARNISHVFSENLAMSVYVDRCLDKARLLDFPKTLDILFQAWHIENNESDWQIFLSELRKAVRWVKKKQKRREQQEQVQ